MKNLTKLVNANVISELDEETKAKYMKLLLSALSEEFGAWYFYILSKDFLVGYNNKEISDLFETNGKDELEDHGYWLLERIRQLGGSVAKIAYPNMWGECAQHEYIPPIFKTDGNIDTYTIIELAIQSELDAIDTYKELVEFSGAIGDITSNEKLKHILKDEEKHLSDLQKFVQ